MGLCPALRDCTWHPLAPLPHQEASILVFSSPASRMAKRLISILYRQPGLGYCYSIRKGLSWEPGMRTKQGTGFHRKKGRNSQSARLRRSVSRAQTLTCSSGAVSQLRKWAHHCPSGPGSDSPAGSFSNTGRRQFLCCRPPGTSILEYKHLRVF